MSIQSVPGDYHRLTIYLGVKGTCAHEMFKQA